MDKTLYNNPIPVPVPDMPVTCINVSDIISPCRQVCFGPEQKLIRKTKISYGTISYSQF